MSARLLSTIMVLGTILGLPTGLRANVSTEVMPAEFAAALADFDRAQQQFAEQPEAARPLFRAAAQRMESLAARVPNGYLEYNIGNAFLQAGDIGRAILHYRRAERFIPRDPLLADNLREARSRTLLPIKAGPRDQVLGTLFFWHFQTALRERAAAAMVGFIVFWIVLAVRLFVRQRSLSILAVVAAVVCLISGASVLTEMWKDRNAPAGVILAMDVAAYKGPGTSYQRQFEQPLQPGVEFTLRERRGQWWHMELPDGKSGWIDAADADLVVTERTFAQRG